MILEATMKELMSLPWQVTRDSPRVILKSDVSKRTAELRSKLYRTREKANQ